MKSTFLFAAAVVFVASAAAQVSSAQTVATQPGNAQGLYLPATETHGGNWCFNPNSRRVREILNSPNHQPTDPVDANAFAADLADLREFLRTEYPGYSVLAQKPGFDVDDFFRRWRESLAGKDKVPFSEAVVAPLQRLRDEVVDQHLSIPFPGADLKKGTLLDVREYQAALEGSPPDFSKCSVEGARRVYESTLRSSRQRSATGERSLITVSAVANNPLKLHCAEHDWTLNERTATPMAKDADGTPFYTWNAVGSTAVIRIRRLFGSTKDLENLSHIPQDYFLHAKFKRIIFDLRANGGGNDGYVYDWISKAKNGTWSSGAETKRIGALAPCEDWNIAVYRQVKDGTVDSSAAKAEREKIKAAWPQRPPDFNEKFTDGLIEDKSDHPYKGKIYVLIDRQSTSSGESSAFVLRQALGAVVLGERSAGFLTFGNQRPVILPRSGIRFMVPTKRNWFDTPMETVGVPVDIYLENTAMPVQELLPLLNKLESAGSKR